MVIFQEKAVFLYSTNIVELDKLVFSDTLDLEKSSALSTATATTTVTNQNELYVKIMTHIEVLCVFVYFLIRDQD